MSSCKFLGKLYKILSRIKRNNTFTSNAHLGKINLLELDFWFYISCKIKVRPFCMVCPSGFFVESPSTHLWLINAGQSFDDLGQFTDFWPSLRTKLRAGCLGRGPGLSPPLPAAMSGAAWDVVATILAGKQPALFVLLCVTSFPDQVPLMGKS